MPRRDAASDRTHLVMAAGNRTIAGRLGRAPSTISREIRRHGGIATYRAAAADSDAWAAAGLQLVFHPA